MPRKGFVRTRKLSPDPVHKSVLVHKLINKVLMQGKKSKAEKIVYSALDIAAQKTKKAPLEALEQAMHNIMPHVEVKSRRVGGATYQVPVEVRHDRKTALGLRWLVGYARKRNGKTMAEKLGAELVDAANNTGSAVKKREDTHKMADANKAFAHYRW